MDFGKIAEGGDPGTMTENRFGLFVLRGPVFDRVGMPVEATAELIAYKALVLDVAKKLYLRENPHRERSRRNLANEFDLRIERVDPGSADVQLLLERPANLLSGLDVDADYFEVGRDVISRAIESVSASGKVPDEFPVKSLPKFRALGKTLAPGHSLLVGDLRGNFKAVLDLPTRDRFLQILDADSRELNQDAVGTLVELDPERLIFHLRTSDGERLQCYYGGTLPNVDRTLLSDENGDGPLVSVQGKALVSRDGVLQRFTEVNSLEPVSVPEVLELEEQLARIAELPENWLDETSKSVDAKVLAVVRDAAKRLQIVPQGFVPAPLPDGGLRFEWSKGRTEYVAEIEASGGVYFCVLPEDSSGDDERQLDGFDVQRFLNFVEDGELD